MPMSPLQLLKIIRLLNLDLPIPLHTGNTQFRWLPHHRFRRHHCLFAPPIPYVPCLLPLPRDRQLHRLLHDPRGRIRNLIHVPVCEDVADATATRLDQDRGWARELEEEAVAPDGAAGPGADAMEELGEEFVGF